MSTQSIIGDKIDIDIRKKKKKYTGIKEKDTCMKEKDKGIIEKRGRKESNCLKYPVPALLKYNS